MRKNGSVNVFFILFLFVFVIVTAVTVEFYHIFTLKEHIDTELSRALNIATDYAILDEYRMEHISMIDMQTAQNEFDSYLHQEMKLNSSKSGWKTESSNISLSFTKLCLKTIRLSMKFPVW